mmetsp:Transcript_18451/g.47312  ORF Transcript_18451/g.47312 Transcript_18451/m.47312 type:complete len:299 (+) Transcript_18451:3-899(+)
MTANVAALVIASLAMSSAPTPAPRYGFVGVGTMSSAIVRGMCTLPTPPMQGEVVLSPRGAAKAAALAAEFPGAVKIASSNQEVIDSCDIILVGVLPKQCEEVLRELRFEARHTVVSLVSTAPMALLHEVCAPVPKDQVVRAIPLPPVAKHKGATVMSPPHPTVSALFGSLGTVVPVETEAMMKKMMPVTGLMGQLYAQHRATQQWLEAQGVDSAAAAKWTGAVFHTVTYDSAVASPQTFEELVHEQTPGGLNEQVIREMTEAGAYTALADSLDNCLARIEARPAPARTKRPYSSITSE